MSGYKTVSDRSKKIAKRNCKNSLRSNGRAMIQRMQKNG